MKNKILASITALCAALVLVGGFSVTAYAQTPTEETNDSGVIVETEPQPLTPEYITDLQKVVGYGAMSMPALVVNEKVVAMGKVLKAADVEKLLHKLGF